MKLEAFSSFDKSFKIIQGDSSLEVQGLANSNAPNDGHVLFFKNKNFLKQVHKILDAKNIQFGAILEAESADQIMSQELWSELSPYISWVATVESIPLAMSFLSKPFYQKKYQGLNAQLDARKSGRVDIHVTAQIAENVFIGQDVVVEEDVVIHPGCVIMARSLIKKGTIIYPNVSIYPFVTIGENCRIHSQAVIGADGFGYNFHQGVHHKVWHMGGVIIEDEVEIGSSTSVDAGTFSPTMIGAGSKIDNLVQVGHNTVLGKGVIMCGHSGTAGSVTVGDYAVFGGRVSVGPGVSIGKACQLAGAAAVTGNVEDGAVVAGHPARPIKEWLKGVAWLRKMSLRS